MLLKSHEREEAGFIGLNFASEPLKKVKDESSQRAREAQRTG